MNTDGQHHLHVRKRMYKKLEPFPHPNKFKRYFDRGMFAIAIVGPLATLPQLLQTFSTKDVEGLSATSWVLYLFLTLAWLGYGLLHKEKPIVISQSIYLVFNIAILGAIFVYG